MNWETKAAIQAVLSRVPMGEQIHRKLQDVGGTAVEASANYGRRRNFLNMLRARGLPVQDRSFLEVGTGWHPLLPMLLSLLGAQTVVTMDLHRWMTPRSLRETLDSLERSAGNFSEEFGVPAKSVHAVIAQLRDLLAGGKHTLEQMLRTLRIDYRCPADACASGLPQQTLDYVVSTNVLEHVLPSAIRRMMAESRRILRPGAYIVHYVDLSDHFSYDKRITTINFLRYSPRAWYFIGGSGIAYHNRLRAPDYIAMVEEAGFEIVQDGAEVDTRALEALSLHRVRPHPAFETYTAEQLCTRTLVLIARAPR